MSYISSQYRLMEVKKLFVCTIPGCQITFNKQCKLERHHFKHTGERPYRCDRGDCSKAYQCKQHLVRHIKTTHEKLEVALPCPLLTCKAIFSCEAALAKHMENHGKPRRFLCSTCGVSFQKKYRYSQHVLVHSGKFAFTCNICNSGFGSNSLLRRHLKCHARRHCSYDSCSYSCDSRSLIRKHEKLFHSPVYNCADCKKSFNNKGTLREHVMIHLPQEHRGVFACPHTPCQRSYFQIRNLRHHIKVFHNFPRHYCQVQRCSSSFISESQLEKHVLRNHSKNETERRENLIKSLISIVPAIEDSSSERETKSQFNLTVTYRDHF